MHGQILTLGRLVGLVALVISGCGGDDAPEPPVDAGNSDAHVDGGDSSQSPPSMQPGPDDAGPPPSSIGSCCETQDTPGCDDPVIEACVCTIDRLCCAGAWDERCVQLVDSEGCGQCGAPPTAICEITEATEAVGVMHGALALSGAAPNDALELSCGSIAEPEILFAFTAPEAGSYEVTTQGSEVIDTVLSVIEGASCDGAELGCSDDYGDELTSRLVVELEAGQEILIAVESWGEETGAVAVEIAAAGAPVVIDGGSCRADDLPSALPASVTGEAHDDSDLLTPSCALYGSAGEALYRFTAEQAGYYRFDTRGSEADTVVQVLDGDCAGEELACNDDSDLGGLAAVAELELSAGQSVLINVDSFDGTGSYTLTVDHAEAATEDPGAMNTGSCCSPQLGAGCEDQAIADCVCAQDDFCCTNIWDELCVDAVATLECGSC